MASEIISLWPENQVPGALGLASEDTPTLTVFRPRRANGAAIIVCPGGGYGMLADHEGAPIAEWLNTLGVTGLVLRYRLGPRYHHPIMLGDAQRALRTVRARSREWELDKDRVGILGFSAGGHLASTAATHFDDGQHGASDPIEQESSRPDLAVLLYPVITLDGEFAHAGSRQNLLGNNPPAALVRDLSNQNRVTPKTPPTFLLHTNEDEPVPAENSIEFALALRRAKVPVELHLFEKGAHGVGLAEKDPALRVWPELCAKWLQGRGFLG